MRSASILEEDHYNARGFLHEVLESIIRREHHVLFVFIIEVMRIQNHVLLDGKDQRSDCAALSVRLVGGQTDEDNRKKLIDCVEAAAHDLTDVREDLLSKAPDFEIGVRH